MKYFVLLCNLTLSGCFLRSIDNTYQQNLLKAITCQIKPDDSESLFVDKSVNGNIAAVGEFFPLSEVGSLKVSILYYPLSFSGSQATHFLYSRRDFEGNGFPGIVYGQFVGKANQIIKDLNLVNHKSNSSRFLKRINLNGSCSRALYLQKETEDFFLLGCGYCSN